MEDYQLNYFHALKERHTGNENFVDIVAEILDLSKQGAYKKIRGATKLTLDEVAKLSVCFKLSIDAGIGLYSTSDVPYQFHSNALRYKPSTMMEYWENIRNHITSLWQLEPTNVTYLANELPFHHFMPFEHILEFKIFNWNNSSWKLGEDQSYTNKHLIVSPKIKRILTDILDKHNSITSTEIWNSNMLQPLYSQLKYWIQAGLFTDPDKLQLLLDQIEDLFQYLELISNHGVKKSFTTTVDTQCIVFVNDVMVNSELIYIESPTLTTTYTMYDSPNYLRSSDIQVCTHAKSWLNEIIESSTIITKSNAAQRNRFFDTLRREHQKQRVQIEALLAYMQA